MVSMRNERNTAEINNSFNDAQQCAKTKECNSIPRLLCFQCIIHGMPIWNSKMKWIKTTSSYEIHFKTIQIINYIKLDKLDK